MKKTTAATVWAQFCAIVEAEGFTVEKDDGADGDGELFAIVRHYDEGYDDNWVEFGGVFVTDRNAISPRELAHEFGAMVRGIDLDRIVSPIVDGDGMLDANPSVDGIALFTGFYYALMDIVVNLHDWADAYEAAA